MKKSIGILLYLVMMAVFLKFDLRLLFDFRQLLLVVFGTFLLLLPSLYEQSSNKKGRESQETEKENIVSGWKHFFREERVRIGQNAVWAGLLQSFVLLFVNMNIAEQEVGSRQTVALSCRPILYGFCIWVILQDSGKAEKHAGRDRNQDSERMAEKAAREEPQETVDYRKCLQDLGLTKREVEVALLVIQKETNAEIADRLFISETTVKKHLSNIFSKLCISQRQEIKERCISFSADVSKNLMENSR